MKAIHGGKTKNDRLDSYKIAALLRGGNLPYAYVYPRQMRATRDLLRRRLFFSRKRGELLAHIKNTNTQYNLPTLEERPDKTKDRGAIIEHFDDNTVQMSIAADVALLDSYDQTIRDIELYLIHEVRKDRNREFYLLRSIPGIGEILSLTLTFRGRISPHAQLHSLRFRFSKYTAEVGLDTPGPISEGTSRTRGIRSPAERISPFQPRL